jgi:kinesin family protein 5
LFEGINGTIFAYGQTSSGKTHTMQGALDDENKKGITPRIINNIFEIISQSKTNIEFNISIAMIEIYMEKIRVLII